MKQKRPSFTSGGKAKPVVAMKTRDGLTIDDGIRRHREMVIDPEKHRYTERVLNPDGSVRHEANEPLDEQFGHGSAKGP